MCGSWSSILDLGQVLSQVQALGQVLILDQVVDLVLAVDLVLEPTFRTPPGACLRVGKVFKCTFSYIADHYKGGKLPIGSFK